MQLLSFITIRGADASGGRKRGESQQTEGIERIGVLWKTEAEAENCRNCIVFEYSAYLSAARQLSGLTHTHTLSRAHTPAHISINYFYDSHKAHKTLSRAPRLL